MPPAVATSQRGSTPSVQRERQVEVEHGADAGAAGRQAKPHAYVSEGPSHGRLSLTAKPGSSGVEEHRGACPAMILGPGEA